MSAKQRKPKIDPALLRHLKRALPLVEEMAVDAGDFLMSKFGKLKHVRKKADESLVSEADKGAEKIILKALKTHFPQDDVIAEESGKTVRKNSYSPFRWHVDPLDGTTNFVHGFPMFCVSIGLEFEQNNFALGVIYHPSARQLFSGLRGEGAYCNGKRMRVSSTKSLEEALLTTGFSYRRSEFFESEIRSFQAIGASCKATRRTGSAALDLAFVAAGQFDGFWEQGLSSWDICAGTALVQEAGGVVTDMSGAGLAIGSKSIAATNGTIHDQLLLHLS